MVSESKRVRILLNVATGVLALSAVLVAIIRLQDVLFAKERGAEPPPERIEDWQRIGAEGIRLGPVDARVTIVEFSDFLCPFCRGAAVDLREIRRKFPTEISVVYRHFPVHDAALPAAIAAECASRTGSFEAMHDALFDNPALIGSLSWSQFAMKAGIADTAQFLRCMASDSAALVVKRDMEAAAQLGVTGTPTLFINDLRINRNPGWEQIEAHINRALGREPRDTTRQIPTSAAPAPPSPA